MSNTIVKKYKSFSIINIFGLAMGIASCILITLYIKEELSYDRYHENSDRIYRIVTNHYVIQAHVAYLSGRGGGTGTGGFGIGSSALDLL